MFEKQSIGGAAKQENQQVDRTGGEIALDVESLPCANGCSEALEPSLAVGKCFGDRESGSHTIQEPDGACLGKRGEKWKIDGRNYGLWGCWQPC